jgi:hypothetical protein
MKDKKNTNYYIATIGDEEIARDEELLTLRKKVREYKLTYEIKDDVKYFRVNNKGIKYFIGYR